MNITHKIPVAVILMSLLFPPSGSLAKQLIVNVSSIPPCAIFCDNRVTGFSIDLWERCAESLGWNYRYNKVVFKNKLPMVVSGEADVAIAGISITGDREMVLDFSMPTLNSGLRIMVVKDARVIPVLTPGSKKMLLYVFLFLLIFGHILWLSEKNSPAINDKYIPGIFEAFWFVAATMSSVGYGDIVPKKWLGRVMAVLTMFCGIALFGIIVATFTANFVVEKQKASILNYRDIMGMKVGTKSGTTSEEFLKNLDVRICSYPTINEAYEKLRKGQIEVVVYDEPSILYFCISNPRFAPAGETFAKQYYGFAFSEGSKLVEQFNHALLSLRENGTYLHICEKWFGAGYADKTTKTEGG